MLYVLLFSGVTAIDRLSQYSFVAVHLIYIDVMMLYSYVL